MRTLKPSEFGKLPLNLILHLLAGFLAVCWAAPAAAQEGGAGTNTVVEGAGKTQSPATNQPSSAVRSPCVAEVMRMADAGVSKEVIKTYIESTPTAKPPGDEDIIAMKQHNVADDIVTLMITRGAEGRMAAAQARQEALARFVAARGNASGGLDPESHDYFQYYYLQPRALASAYQRLAPYSYPGLAYPRGYGSMSTFGPRYFGRPVYPHYPGYAPEFHR
jgi:hypothetical protein